MDWGVYDVDWLRFVLGESFDPAEILGAIDQWGHEEAALETSFAAEIICRSGATIGWERRSEIGPPAQRVEIRGSKGGVDLPFMPGGSSSVLTRHLPEGDCGSKASEASSPMSGWDTILAFPVVDLAEALVFDRPVSSAPPVQRQIHQLIAAFYRSAESQRSIAID